jgi:hypothetical protein
MQQPEEVKSVPGVTPEQLAAWQARMEQKRREEQAEELKQQRRLGLPPHRIK